MWTSTDLFRASVLWSAPSSSRYRWLKPWAAASSCRNSKTARTLRRVSALWPAASSCRHRWFKPWAAASSCRNSRTARNDSDQLGLDPVVIHVSQPLLESLSLAQTVLVVDVHPPRVVIRGRPPTCTFRWAHKIPYRGVNPAHKIPYRPWCNQTPVAIVVQTRGSTSSSCR